MSAHAAKKARKQAIFEGPCFRAFGMERADSLRIHYVHQLDKYFRKIGMGGCLAAVQSTPAKMPTNWGMAFFHRKNLWASVSRRPYKLVGVREESPALAASRDTAQHATKPLNKREVILRLSIVPDSPQNLKAQTPKQAGIRDIPAPTGNTGFGPAYTKPTHRFRVPC